LILPVNLVLRIAQADGVGIDDHIAVLRTAARTLLFELRVQLRLEKRKSRATSGPAFPFMSQVSTVGCPNEMFVNLI